VLPFLFLVPVFTSVVFGVVFVLLGDVRARTKGLVLGVFVIAAYLQFFSRFVLAGMLVQIGLALTLVLWRRFDSGR
jgi:hypothetical protein